MDEYVGLPKEHPESYHSFMYNNFFNCIDIQPQILIFRWEIQMTAMKNVAAMKRKLTTVRLTYLWAGVGVDGHIAFNEPASSLASRNFDLKH